MHQQTRNQGIPYCLVHSQNCNGLKSRLPQFNADVLTNNAKIYMICEDKLDDSVNSSEVFPPNFNVYRCDRSEETELWQKTKKKRGGGVLIAIEKSIKSQLVGTGASFGAEQIWAKIILNNRNIFLVEAYLRPDSPVEVYEANMGALREITAKMQTEDVLILSGDFNLPNLSWFTDDNDDPEIAIPINASGKKELIILDTCHELGLHQINKHSNDNGNMLDLIWTNCVDIVSCQPAEHHLLNHESHHISYSIKIHGLEMKQNKVTSQIEYRNFMGADYDTINEKLFTVNWDDVLTGTNLDTDINQFYNIINSVVSENVELKTETISNHPKWFTSELINIKNRVDTLQRRKKSCSSTEAIVKHADLRRQYKSCARLAFKNYKLEMEQLIDKDPTKFFEYVNCVRKTHDDLPSEMEYNGVKLNCQQDIADTFAKHFEKAYTKQNDVQTDSYKDCESLLRDLCINIPTIEITDDLILETVNILPNNTVSGPDGIPNIFIKKCIHTLVKPITHILSESLKTGFVPDIWKRSYVRPIHKSGIKAKIDNYRGVALQCVISKILDSIVSSHLNFHI
ncbi:uncharacterized protein LOC129572922 [Sitodiplosis mosellana]|uniref:uncharacterized protein LOC129572922 n=1 Tax=Sitodiplosis mosellana TaxID=263140 RepID=UPI002444B8BC|nr:uncharacterized protein LOC129572922 [Sitodiplosis mosellana]